MAGVGVLKKWEKGELGGGGITQQGFRGLPPLDSVDSLEHTTQILHVLKFLSLTEVKCQGVYFEEQTSV